MTEPEALIHELAVQMKEACDELYNAVVVDRVRLLASQIQDEMKQLAADREQARAQGFRS